MLQPILDYTATPSGFIVLLTFAALLTFALCTTFGQKQP
jgi:hypothetical protein